MVYNSEWPWRPLSCFILCQNIPFHRTHDDPGDHRACFREKGPDRFQYSVSNCNACRWNVADHRGRKIRTGASGAGLQGIRHRIHMYFRAVYASRWNESGEFYQYNAPVRHVFWHLNGGDHFGRTSRRMERFHRCNIVDRQPRGNAALVHDSHRFSQSLVMGDSQFAGRLYGAGRHTAGACIKRYSHSKKSLHLYSACHSPVRPLNGTHWYSGKSHVEPGDARRPDRKRCYRWKTGPDKRHDDLAAGCRRTGSRGGTRGDFIYGLADHPGSRNHADQGPLPGQDQYACQREGPPSSIARNNRLLRRDLLHWRNRACE